MIYPHLCKWRPALAALVALLLVAPIHAAALDAAPLPAKPVEGPFVVADAASGAVLAHADALRPWYPASTTKLMTVYVALRAVAAGELTLESPVTISARAAAEPASKMGFKAGSTLTLDDALKIMMVKSANDIALAVAETVGGSEAGFAERMNADSRRLGMTRSHWVNPHGLPDERQVSSARDMAVLARALLTEFPQHRSYFSIHAIEIGGKILENFNPLIARYPGASGMKTGFICASGYNLVASARRGDREVIAVVFGEYGGRERAERAAELLDAAFQRISATVPQATLATVDSGEGFAAPLDMRPYVCAPRQAEKAADSVKPLALAAAATGDFLEPLSRLGPPIDLGPPIKVSVRAPQKRLRPGQAGFSARLPNPRPRLPSDIVRAGFTEGLEPNGATDAEAGDAAARLP